MATVPQPPAGSYVINPGSVYQSYNPNTGVTSYPTAPSSFTAGAAPQTSGVNYGIGANQGQVVNAPAPSVVTPTTTPAGASVYQANGTYQPSSVKTNFTQSGAEAPNSMYSQVNNKFSEVKAPTTLELPSEKVTEKASKITAWKDSQTNAKARIDAQLASNPNITNSIANKAFIDAAFMASKGRYATPQELSSSGVFNDANGRPLGVGMANKTVGEVLKALGMNAPTSLPGANDQNPDSYVQPDLKYQDPTGLIDLQKFQADMESALKGINDLIAQERESFDTSIANIGNQPGVAMPLIQGQQAYQNQLKDIKLNRLLDEKKALLETADIKLKFMDYARTLRKDQQDAMAKVIELSLNNGVTNKEIISQWAMSAGLNPEATYDGLALAAANMKTDKVDTQVVTAGGKSLLINTQTGETIKDLGGAYKTSSGGSSSGGTATVKLTQEEKDFQTDLNKALDDLAMGGDWGTNWNYLKNRYDVPNETLDQLLQKDKYYPKTETSTKKWYEFWK